MPSQGDFNVDGVINALDFNVIASDFGVSSVASVSEASPRTPTIFADL